MRLIPHAFNGFLFQQKNKVASDWLVKYDWNIQGITTNSIPRSQNFPQFSAKNYVGNIKTITVNFTDVDPNKNDLIIAMDVLGEDQHQLLSTDEFGRTWYLNAICLGINEEAIEGSTASFGVVFEVDDPIWKVYTPSTQTILVNGTGNGTITPLGNQPALPIITITPTGAGSFGFLYKRFVQIINKSPNALNSYPLDITNGGLNTAALVAAGKMLASGGDLRIFVDGVEVKRWFGGGGINSATTTIWINWTQPANTNMTLGAAIAGAGAVGTITLEETAANIALMPTIPITGNILIGTEIFVYTGVNVGLRQLTGCTRAERLTSAGAHSVGDTVYFVTHDVWMYYGDATITRPYVVDDTNKPIINLVTSTNTSHVYEEFGNPAGLRSGQWVGSSLDTSGGQWVGSSLDTSGGQSTGSSTKLYSAAQGVGLMPPGVNPYTAIGILSLSDIVSQYLRFIAYWQLYNPCGITTVTATGNKFRADVYWPEIKLQAAITVGTWDVIWTEATPVASGGFEALDAHSSVALGASYPYIILSLYGEPPYSYLGNTLIDFTEFTAVIDSTQVPTISVSSENSNFQMKSTLTNAANGYTMLLNLSLALNTTVIVNTKEKTIVLFDGTNAINALVDMPIRAEWFPLLPSQANLISITDAAQITFAFSYEDRALS